MEYIPRQVSNSDVKDTTIDHTAVAESFIHLATAAPTKNEDEGTGYAVGCLWIDDSNGKTYACIDSTDEGAQWAAQDGSDDVNIFKMQGTNNGWLAGGNLKGPSPATVDPIVRFAFASPVAGTDVGELSTVNTQANKGSIRDSTAAFVVGGINSAAPALLDTIERFTFAAPSTVTDAGEYIAAYQKVSTSTNGTHGFVFGGASPAVPGSVDTQTKLAFTAPYAQSDNGELSAAREDGAGHSDLTHSYSSGGAYWPSPGNLDIIERFPFAATSGTYSDVGNLTAVFRQHGSASGPTHGLSHGGNPVTDRLERFEFASSGNASDIGEATQAGKSSGSNGPDAAYFVGGSATPGSPTVNTATKVPWATTSGGGTDVGEIAIFPAYGFEEGAGGYEN